MFHKQPVLSKLFLCLAALTPLVAANPESCPVESAVVPDSPPRSIRLYTPRYTKKAMKDKVEGKIQLTFDVDVNGEVQDPKIVSGIGNGLDETAVEAIMMSKFYPAYKNGQPVLTHARHTFDLHVPKNSPPSDKPLTVEQVQAARKQKDSRGLNMVDTAPGGACPRLKYKVEPDQTPEASEANFKGNIGMSFVVNEEGIPTDVKVTRSAGMGLDQEATSSVLKWRYYPAVQDGKPVKTRVNVNVNFRAL